MEADVTDRNAVADAVREARPEAVIHLAAISSVAASWGGGARTWEVNAVGTVNVLDAVREHAPDARIIAVGTGEVYGRADEIPTTEDAPLAPLSPYAASKAAAEVACGRAARADGLDVIVARSFPHAGPGRTEDFAIGSWARQIARLEKEGGGPLLVGDLSVERDLTDVRDVCRAYRLLLDRDVAAGVYNVATGRAVPLTRIVELLVESARVDVSVEQDAARLRPADVPVVCGDASRLRAATGWRPEIPLATSLADALEAARQAG